MTASPRYVPSRDRLKIGHITPSSNTVIEPVTELLSRDLAGAVSHHFARIRVDAISLQARHRGQFAADRMLAAAELLADAAVDAIVWNGTSGGWNGLAADRELCALIAQRTGIQAATTTLAQLELLQRMGFERCALAVPYTAEVTRRIEEVLGDGGITVCGRSHASVTNNRAMADVTEDHIRGLARNADSADAECVLIYCTGVAGAQLVAELEQELGKPVYDSVAVSLWKGLRMVGIEPRLPGWGSLLAGVAAVPAGGA